MKYYVMYLESEALISVSLTKKKLTSESPLEIEKPFDQRLAIITKPERRNFTLPLVHKH